MQGVTFHFQEAGSVYLNSAALSPLSHEANLVIRSFNDEYATQIDAASFIDRETSAVEVVRNKIQALINALHAEEIIFVRSATEGINLIARGLEWLPGDEILLSDNEHLANYIPWQHVAKQKGLVLRTFYTTVEGRVDEESLLSSLTPRTKVLSLAHASQITGCINDIETIFKKIQNPAVIRVVDASQTAGRIPIDVQALGCDYLVASGRKGLMGPLGTAFIYGRAEALASLRPLVSGTRSVRIEDITIDKDAPNRFEANLPTLAYLKAFGLGIDVLITAGMNNVWHELQNLTARLLQILHTCDKVTVFAETDLSRQIGIVSFTAYNRSVAELREQFFHRGIVLGSGSFGSVEPLRKYGHSVFLRASLHAYNTERELAILDAAIQELL